ncbi:MAG: response regulator [Magnetococcales bacterium]|nr:response regulator [Magnetococcales bacterium]
MTNILVIDDDSTIRFLLKAILEQAGYHVLCASGGDEGLQLFRAHTIELVITDILMPGTDGLAVIRELLASDPETKIIALSGGGMVLTAEISLHVARRMGAFESLAKPFTRDELLAMVHRILQASELSTGEALQDALPLP